MDAPKVEFDAVPVEELRRRVRRAVEGLLEWDTWERYVQTQQVELKVYRQFREAHEITPELRHA